MTAPPGSSGSMGLPYRLMTQSIVIILMMIIRNTDGANEIFENQSCNPGAFSAKVDLRDETRFYVCDELTRKITSKLCPTENGVQLIFDRDKLICVKKEKRTRRTPHVPRSSRLAEPCVYNTDCLSNLYCLAGSCVCIPGFVDMGDECVPAINPGQTGCIYDKQCAGAWPSTTCKLGVCQCPHDQFPVETRDGFVCVKAGRCPLPDGYLGSSPLDQLSTDTTCRYADNAITDDKACFVNGQYAGDIYDCIPKAAEKQTTTDGICCPSRALTCIQPKAAVSDGIEIRYWYNSLTGQCESFSWSATGSVGNSNNFRSPDQCMAYCGGMCSRGPAQISRGKSIKCLSAENICEGDHYSCSANAGKLKHCCPVKDFICSNQGGRSYNGALPPNAPDLGSAPAPSTTGGNPQGGSAGMRWFYDRKAGRCIGFGYKGLGGNFNNFLTENECQMFCGKAKCEQGEPLKDHFGNDQDCTGMVPCPKAYECRKSVCCPKSQTVCLQPKFLSAASCGATSRQRFWFNARTRDCEEFNDGGCRGNDNSFDTYAACMSFCSDTKAVVKCVQGEPDKDSSGEYRKCSNVMNTCRENFECYFDGFSHGCCPTKEFTCHLPAESGSPCSTSTVRWFYDYALRLCRPFEYLGCDGNGNNFSNRRECERFCDSGVQVGCPYGGGSSDDGPDSWRGRVCDPHVSDPCSNGFDCMKVFVNGQFANYCCPTRAHLCRLEQKQGSTCSSASISRRYFFNSLTKECEEFSFRGCNANENNFVTLSQCVNFCHAAACNPGETVYMDTSTRDPLTCRVSAADTTCPAGYTCVYNELLKRPVCCGSTDMGVCPAGEKAYIDPTTQEAKSCTSTRSKDECPSGYFCRSHLPNKMYCCNPAVSGAYCPPGRTMYKDSETQQPQACDAAADASRNKCPGGYSCFATKGGRRSGYCCSSDAEYKKDNSLAGKSCPRGYVGYKQPGANVVRTCSHGSSSPASSCPQGYTCTESPMDGRNRCCGVSGGCPYPTVAYINARTSQPQKCRQGGQCPSGYICKPTSSGTYTCCSSTVSISMEDEDDPSEIDEEIAEMVEPRSQISTRTTEAPQQKRRAKCPNEVEDDSGEDNGERKRPAAACDPDHPDSCPIGYECQLSANTDENICCRVSRSVCNGQSMPYINPASRKAQACVSGSNRCPSGYRCSYSNFFEKFYCCSTAEICPTGHRAYLPSTDPTPRRCAVTKGTKNPCPSSHTCMYSLLLKDYVCCARATSSGQQQPNNQQQQITDYSERNSVMEKRSLCSIPCSPKGMHAGRLCPHGYQCEDIGQGVRRCCPIDENVDDMENEKEPHEIEPDPEDICNRPVESSFDLDLYSSTVSFRPSVWHCHPSDPSSCEKGRECRYLGIKRGFRCCPPIETPKVTPRPPTSGGEWPPPQVRVIMTTRRPPPANAVAPVRPQSVTTLRNAEPCRTGAPFRHPVTKTPLVCSTSSGFCPAGYFCEFSGSILRYICCPRVYSSAAAQTPGMVPPQTDSLGGLYFLPGGGIQGTITGQVTRLSPGSEEFFARSYMNPVPAWNFTTIAPPGVIPAIPQQQTFVTSGSVTMEESQTIVASNVLGGGTQPAVQGPVAPLSETCDLRQKKKIGQDCCHDSQCGSRYPCRYFAGRRICRCPMNLVLDMTVYPFRCTSSCLYYLQDSVCTLKQQQQ